MTRFFTDAEKMSYEAMEREIKKEKRRLIESLVADKEAADKRLAKYKGKNHLKKGRFSPLINLCDGKSKLRKRRIKALSQTHQDAIKSLELSLTFKWYDEAAGEITHLPYQIVRHLGCYMDESFIHKAMVKSEAFRRRRVECSNFEEESATKLSSTL